MMPASAATLPIWRLDSESRASFRLPLRTIDRSRHNAGELAGAHRLALDHHATKRSEGSDINSCSSLPQTDSFLLDRPSLQIRRIASTIASACLILSYESRQPSVRACFKKNS